MTRPLNQHCTTCNTLFPRDLLTTYDLGTDGIDLVSLCDKCLSKHPKKDPREWRREEHPENGVITWFDGSKSYVNAEGVIMDLPSINFETTWLNGLITFETPEYGGFWDDECFWIYERNEKDVCVGKLHRPTPLEAITAYLEQEQTNDKP